MSGKKGIKCETCGQTIEIDAKDNNIPECCGLAMIQGLPVCLTTDTAEHARFSDDGEPCDDFRTSES